MQFQDMSKVKITNFTFFLIRKENEAPLQTKCFIQHVFLYE